MDQTKKLSLKMDELSRRQFVAGVAESVLGVTLLSYGTKAFAADSEVPPPPPGGGKAKNVIFLYMPGGMTHMDTWDPKSHPDSKGPTEELAANVPGIRIANHMPELAKQMDKLAVIRSMSTVTGAHDGGNYAMHTGFRERPGTSHPHLGSWAQHFLGRRNELLPDSVIVGGGNPGPGFFDATLAPMPVGDPSKGIKDMLPKIERKEFDHRIELARGFAYRFQKEFPHDDVKAYSDFYEETIKFFDDETVKAFDVSAEPKELRDRYGNTRYGQSALLAKRLIQHGVRYVEVSSLGGWDMHAGIVTDRINELDRVTATLIADLEENGMLDSTMVVMCSEFGRTPINSRGGRDHNPGAFSTMLAGGGVVGGAVHGSSDEVGRKVAEDGVSIADFHSTIAWAMGLPLDVRTHGSGGRPFFVGNKGKPLVHLFA